MFVGTKLFKHWAMSTNNCVCGHKIERISSWMYDSVSNLTNLTRKEYAIKPAKKIIMESYLLVEFPILIFCSPLRSQKNPAIHRWFFVLNSHVTIFLVPYTWLPKSAGFLFFACFLVKVEAILNCISFYTISDFVFDYFLIFVSATI